MASMKTKTGLSETLPSKPSPSTPRLARLSRGAPAESNSPSPIQPPRRSSDRSPRSSFSRSSTERRSPKLPTSTEKTRPNQIKEDLKKANEKIISLEKEKAKALEELRETRREATEKLNEAWAAQKKAEENFEIEKFQAVEAGIEAAQRKEEELKKELENVKIQCALDSAALVSVSEELERVKEEVAAAIDDKSKAVSRADDASKVAEINKVKAEILSSELTRVKALLDSTREKETLLANEISSKLSYEIDGLKEELEKARSFEAVVKEQEMIIARLNVDLESAEEWRIKANEMEERLEEVNNLERSAMKELEGSNDRLREAESEIVSLKEIIGSLEMTAERQREDLEGFERELSMAKEEKCEAEREGEKLRSELEREKEAKIQALKSEKDAALSVERIMEERNKMESELERSKKEEEESKKAMEIMASALHEVSCEARELKEKMMSQGDLEYESQIEDLKLVIKATSEKYENMLDEARHEIDVLVCALEQTNKHFERSKSDWEMKEANLLDKVKRMEEEVASIGKEMNKLSNLVLRAEGEANEAKKEEAEMEMSLKEVEDEVIYLQETLAEAIAESIKLKENLLDKESEFERVVHENEELRLKEEALRKKMEELGKLLEEALVKKEAEEKGENGERREEEKASEGDNFDETMEKGMNNGVKEEEDHEKEQVEFILYRKPEQESQEEEEEEDEEEGERLSKENIYEAVTAEEQMETKKKKKTLFGKVGNLLKKKGSVSHK